MELKTLFIWIYLGLQLIASQLSDEIDACIPDSDTILCVHIDRIVMDGITSPMYIEMNYKQRKKTKIIFKSDTVSRTFSMLQFGYSWSDATSCLLVNKKRELNINFVNASSDAIVGYYNININDFINDNSLAVDDGIRGDITLDNFVSDIGATIRSVDIEFWLSKGQCIEILYGNMFSYDNFLFQVTLTQYSTSNVVVSSEAKQIDRTELDSKTDLKWEWNQLLCPPFSNDNFIDVTFGMVSETASYNSRAINGNFSNSIFISEIYSEYNTSEFIDLLFGVGKVKAKYWTVCNESFRNDLKRRYAIVSILIIVFILVLIGILLGVSILARKTTYKVLDPITWRRYIMLFIKLWSFYADVMVVIFFYTLASIYKSRIGLRFFISSGAFIVFTYFLSLITLIHYLQIWNHPNAPGVTRYEKN